MFIAKPPSVSVLIIVKDEPQIDQTLEILKRQCEEVNAECIVVDASEHRLDLIRIKHQWVRWIDYQQPAGRGVTIPHQRNVAVSAAHSSILLFCDAGGVPSPGWIGNISKSLLDGLQNIVGGPIINSNVSATTAGVNFQEDGEVLRVSTTANIGFTRSAFDLVEGFNEDLNYGSDADFIWKLEAQGIKNICVKNAVMGLDGGSTRRELKRNWLYGKAIVKVLRLHPGKRREKFRSNPDLWAYPLILLWWVASLMLVSKNPTLVLVSLLTTFGLILKNIKEQYPLRIVFRHFIYGAGSIYQVFAEMWSRKKIAPVLIFPSGSTKYTHELTRAINQGQKLIQYYPSLGPSATIRVLLLPLFSPLIRIRGARIVHIHWLYSFSLYWAKGKISRTFIQYWFQLWIVSLRIFRLKIVYTVHNITPHETVFFNDKKIFQYLERSSDILIHLNEKSFNFYLKFYPGKRQAMVPEGPLKINSIFSKEKMKELLHVQDKLLIVLVGYLSPYKQVDLLLNESVHMTTKFALRITGKVADNEYKQELNRQLTKAKSLGVDVNVRFDYLTDNEFGGYLKTADFFCVPFKEINNSGSLNSALCAGVPVIVPNLSSLDWLPSGARINIPCNPEGDFDFKELFDLLENLSVSDHDSMQKAALIWASNLAWQDVAKLHTDLYEELSGKFE